MSHMAGHEKGKDDMKELEEAMRQETTLDTTVHVNNELGVGQDIVTIGEIYLAIGRAAWMVRV
ncbi:hypothetical protein G3W47_29150, partial [Klebsiella pneumoniae]|nr:hypothetical protein [Klebsiella pneumoniae]